MTRISFTSNENGLGSVDFQAPNTNTNHTVALPNAGGTMHTSAAQNDFDLMPTVNGDPIVESGSNTDGEWTKFADGTATATETKTKNLAPGDWSVLTGTNFYHTPLDTWTYPLTFIVRPFAGVVCDQFVIPRSTSSWTGSTVQFNIIRESAAAYSPLTYTLTAIGRWK